MNFSRIYSVFCGLVVLVGSVFWFGVEARTHNLPPLPQIEALAAEIVGVVDPIERVLETDLVSMQEMDPVAIVAPDLVQPGLVALLTLVSPREPIVRVIDRAGNVVHEWRPNWGQVWGDAEGDFIRRPETGIYAHGLYVLPDGSFVANFEHYSTFRMNVCGETLWKLDNYGHHAVSQASDSTLWIPAEDHRSSIPTEYISHGSTARSYLIQQIDLDGNILKSINLIKLIFKNDLDGLLFLRSRTEGPIYARGDTLHLNDIEVVPEGVVSRVLNPGDLVLSMRDINTIMAVDPQTEIVKWVHIGGFVRQHDPDVLTNGKISIYDNQSHLESDALRAPFSRILELDPETGTTTTIIGAESHQRFYSRITGSHERLPNDNILVVASQQGRLLEFASTGKLVWRYDARQTDQQNARIFNAQVLPPHMDEAFFETAKRRCEQ